MMLVLQINYDTWRLDVYKKAEISIEVLDV